MALGIKEYLGMSHALTRRRGEVCIRQVFKVGGSTEDGEANVVVVQKVVEGCEGLVARGEVGRRSEGGIGLGRGKSDGVFEGEGEEQGRREGSFEVDMLDLIATCQLPRNLGMYIYICMHERW